MFNDRKLKNLNLSNVQIIPEAKKGEDAAKLKEETTNMIEMLCTFLKRNKNLIHVDLSYTGLLEDHLKQLSAALRRAKCLLAIHLTGN